MPTRILRLALLLVVVIFLATYTANLASFFTRQSVRVSGPSSLQEFVESPAALKPACFLTKEEAQKFVGYGVRMDGSTIYPNVADDDDADTLIEWCHAALRDGRAGIIVGVSELLAHYIFATPERCQTLVFQEWMRLAPARYSLAFRAEDKEFVGLLSTAIDSLSKTWTYVQKQQEWLYLGRTCTAAAAVTDDDTQPVGFYAMSGLFIIAGSVAGLAVLMAAITRLWYHYGGWCRPVVRAAGAGELDPVDEEGLPKEVGFFDDGTINHNWTDGEILRALLKQMHALRMALRQTQDEQAAAACAAAAAGQAPQGAARRAGE